MTIGNFCHLRVHSQYSILDATASVEALAKTAAEQQMPALAITDHGNLHGAVEFFKACQSLKVHPVIGCELYVAPKSRSLKTKIEGMRPAYSLPVLAKNQTGYRNLCKLSSLGFLEGFYYHPRVDWELLEVHREGLLCLSGSMGTRLASEILYGSLANAKELLLRERDLFQEGYYLDLQRHEMSQEEMREAGFFQETWLMQRYQDWIEKQKKLNQQLIEWAQGWQIPLVATQDVHYLQQADWRAHEILLNIQSGEPCEIPEKDSSGSTLFRKPNPKRETYPTKSYYFTTAEAMALLFSDLPEAISNTRKICDSCQVVFDFKTKHYPVFLPPSLEGKSWTHKEREGEVERFLKQLCQEGLAKRYTEEKLAKIRELYPNQDPMALVQKRLQEELDVIIPKGMADYLLIVWDFINWAKKQGIPMGPGRGSGVGSIVLYLIEVTDIEPIRFQLFFERFINPERISYPDIDVDICMDRRNEVIEYTLRKYGKENIAQIITFGTMKAKMAIRDVGRVLNVPLSTVNEIAKLVPEDLHITLEKALEKDPDLQARYETDPQVARLIDMAKKLEGSIRNTGIHAAGIIISGSPLTDLIPVCNAKDSVMPVTQFSMKPVELVGMLKVDFLGLTTLTAIQKCVDGIAASLGTEKIDWINLPLQDGPTFELLNQGKTLGIFQLESGGMQDLARQLHLDRFEEIIAVGALYRPGPMDMIPSFIQRKHGKEAIENDHPWLKEILQETYGIMVYQEQVMQIASKLAGFSLGEGDVLRRAMGKKDLEQMAAQREKFRLGAMRNQISEETAMTIFDKMEKFASYGFNKSHAAAYGYLSYVTAYMKANYPKEWMAALMTCSKDDLSKVAKFIRECQALSIPVLPPDINESGMTFQATRHGIRFAIGGIKGIGSNVVEAIVEERQSQGLFQDLYSFCCRIDTKKVGKKNVVSLIEAGCFDYTGWTRDQLLLLLEECFEAAVQKKKEEGEGVLSLFSLLGDSSHNSFSAPPLVTKPTPPLEALFQEKALLGFFLTGHPMDQYRPILQRLSCVPLHHAEQCGQETVFRSAFIVEEVQVRISAKSQKKFAILTISDGMEQAELPVWPDLFEEKQLLLKENQLLYAVLQTEWKEGECKLSCRWLDDLTKANEEMILACDRAFDEAKQHLLNRSSIRNKPPSKPQVNQMKKETPPAPPITLQIPMEPLHLSHLLQLRQLLEQHPGPHSAILQFQEGERVLASLHLDPKQGIQPSQALQQQLSLLGMAFAK